MKRGILVVTLAVALALAACMNRSGGADAEASGIRGVVLAGPQCPVETAESPCPDKPLAGVSVDVSRDGRIVGEATTDGLGEFSVSVPPGTYEVQAKPGQPGFMSSSPTRVVVGDGEFARVEVLVDTGIR